MEIGRNPQILDARLATRARAMLMAYGERMEKLEAAPREYYQPNRITRLLVPETRAAEPRRSRKPAAAEADESDDAKDAELEELKRKRERRKRLREKEAAKAADEDNTGAPRGQ